MARDYKKEYANYQGRPEQIARRSSRNKARRAVAAASGTTPKGVKGDVAHRNNNPKDNKKSNLSVQSPSKNRSFPRTKNARRKKK